jgi:hypothetical protein
VFALLADLQVESLLAFVAEGEIGRTIIFHVVWIINQDIFKSQELFSYITCFSFHK